MWLQKCKMDKEKTMQCMWILNTNDAWKQIWSKILETKNFPISIDQAPIKCQLSQAKARLENSRNFLLIENHVRTYVFHMLRTYVMILFNWLILWQNALYLNTNDAWKQIWSKILETKNFPISIDQASIKYQLSQAEARLENSRNFVLIENHVRTYVFHMLRTYVMILCNWLILWQNALYLYLGRLRMYLNTSRNYVSRSNVEAFKSVQEIK